MLLTVFGGIYIDMVLIGHRSFMAIYPVWRILPAMCYYQEVEGCISLKFLLYKLQRTPKEFHYVRTLEH